MKLNITKMKVNMIPLAYPLYFPWPCIPPRLVKLQVCDKL